MQHGRTFLAALILLLSLTIAARADDWPQWRGKDRDGVWRESGIVEKLPEGQIPIKWRVPNRQRLQRADGGRVAASM